jgi:transposase
MCSQGSELIEQPVCFLGYSASDFAGSAFAHLDSTSLHVDGRYNSDAEPKEHVIHLTRGSSREQRPDLNQVRLDLLVEHPAGMPVLMKPLSGNSSDAQDFG